MHENENDDLKFKIVNDDEVTTQVVQFFELLEKWSIREGSGTVVEKLRRGSSRNDNKFPVCHH